METLVINRSKPFSFSKEVKALYGNFSIRQQVEKISKILKFTIEDVEYFDAPFEAMEKASTFQRMVLDEDYVPLDVYCAQAIYENYKALRELQFLWNRSEIDASYCELDTVMFLGSILARNDSDLDHFSFFKFQPMSDKVYFLPFEDDPSFVKNRDFILVFKKSFINSL